MHAIIIVHNIIIRTGFFVAFKIIYKGNVEEFEEFMLSKAKQEYQTKGQGILCKIADIYARQLSMIEYDPYPPLEEKPLSDDDPPSIKHITDYVEYKNFYRWGIAGGVTGNHRIIFAVHNFSKVILLHHFDKKYNGLIKRPDIEPAEEEYANYCNVDPNLY